MAQSPGHGNEDRGESRSEVDNAHVQGNVVQARDVSGGIIISVPPGASASGTRLTPRQLPADVSAFVNRQPEVRVLTRMLSPKRAEGVSAVVVITGSGGVGKTALALHWAHHVRDRFPDGELFVNLRGFDSGPPVTAEVALDRFLRDLGVAPDAIPADLDGRTTMFRSLIADRRILIVLDNAADIGQVRPLIPGAGGSFVIITSRNQLAGLAIRDGAQRIRLDIFQESDAIALLRRVTRSGGRRDAATDLTVLAQLCARLPLALRVAAEHAVSRPTMQLAELIADLRDDSLLWEALSTGDAPHGEAVRTVFAWSYRDLSAEAARMFRVLGLHRGPDVSLSAAAAAYGATTRDARRALDILVGAFLVETVRRGRYQLHDLLRAYALDQARERDSEADRRDVVDRILRWYSATARHASEVLVPGSNVPVDVPTATGLDPAFFETPAAAFEWFDTERPNLAANARSALEAGLSRRAWELAMVLRSIHAQHHAFDDWSVLSEIAVSAAEDLADPAALGDALDNRGKYLFRRRLLVDSRAAHTRALAIREEIGDQLGVLQSLNSLGLIGLRTRRLQEAAAYFSDTARRAQDARNVRWQAVGAMNLAEAHLESGHAVAALAVVASLPRRFTEINELANVGNSLWLLSWTRRLLGDLDAARTAIDQALQIAEDASNRMWEAHWLVEAARVHLALGDPSEAMRCCRMSASLHRQIGDPSREATALDITGEVLAATGNHDDAAAFHQEAARMHRQLGDRWQEALATMHVADCEAALGHDSDAREQVAQALALIREFGDDRAVALAVDLRARLA